MPQHDPFKLTDLPLLQPPAGQWEQIRSQLGASGKKRFTGSHLAALAAGLAGLIILIAVNQRPEAPAADGVPTIALDSQLQQLQQASSRLSNYVGRLEQRGGAISAEAALYAAEIEDLIYATDRQLAQNPDSKQLWGQRVSLLTDLTALYQTTQTVPVKLTSL